MRRRSATRTEAAFYGGGPADGERRPVEGHALAVLIDPPAHDAPPAWLPDGEHDDGEPPVAHAHRYERQDDGRFRYAGVVERRAELPEPVHADAQALGLAALGHDEGPSGLAMGGIVVLVVVAMYCFAIYA